MRWPLRKRSPFAGRDFLDLVPVRAVADAPADDSEGLVLRVPRFRDPVGRRLLQPRLPQARRWVRIVLDAQGVVVWREIDGERPIRAFVPIWKAAFPDDAVDVPERLSRWFYAAYENGLIKFVNL